MAYHPNIDTDRIRDWRELQARLDAKCERIGRCLIYPDKHIVARLAAGEGYAKISPARVAWCIAHPQEHLGVHDYAVHICEHGTGDELRVCCDATHIRKGTLEDIRLMTEVRRRGLILLSVAA